MVFTANRGGSNGDGGIISNHKRSLAHMFCNSALPNRASLWLTMNYDATGALFAVTMPGVVVNYMFVTKKGIMMRQWPRIGKDPTERMTVLPNQATG